MGVECGAADAFLAPRMTHTVTTGFLPHIKEPGICHFLQLHGIAHGPKLGVEAFKGSCT